MRIEDTGGNVTYAIDNCDCGLTGGCPKCRPIHMSRNVEYILPETYGEWFVNDKSTRIKQIREKSYRELGDAWRHLAKY